jgi:hypothetical protein
MTAKLYRIAGDLPGQHSSALEQAFARGPWRVRRYNDVCFEIEGEDVRLDVDAGAAEVGVGWDYLISGSVEGEYDTAVARVRELAALLDRGGIPYQLELDDEGDLESEALVLRHPDFPEDRYPS